MKYLSVKKILEAQQVLDQVTDKIDLDIILECYSCKSTKKQRKLYGNQSIFAFFVNCLDLSYPDYDFRNIDTTKLFLASSDESTESSSEKNSSKLDTVLGNKYENIASAHKNVGNSFVNTSNHQFSYNSVSENEVKSKLNYPYFLETSNSEFSCPLNNQNFENLDEFSFSKYSFGNFNVCNKNTDSAIGARTVFESNFFQPSKKRRQSLKLNKKYYKEAQKETSKDSMKIQTKNSGRNTSIPNQKNNRTIFLEKYTDKPLFLQSIYQDKTATRHDAVFSSRIYPEQHLMDSENFRSDLLQIFLSYKPKFFKPPKQTDFNACLNFLVTKNIVLRLLSASDTNFTGYMKLILPRDDVFMRFCDKYAIRNLNKYIVQKGYNILIDRNCLGVPIHYATELIKYSSSGDSLNLESTRFGGFKTLSFYLKKESLDDSNLLVISNKIMNSDRIDSRITSTMKNYFQILKNIRALMQNFFQKKYLSHDISPKICDHIFKNQCNSQVDTDNQPSHHDSHKTNFIPTLLTHFEGYQTKNCPLTSTENSIKEFRNHHGLIYNTDPLNWGGIFRKSTVARVKKLVQDVFIRSKIFLNFNLVDVIIRKIDQSIKINKCKIYVLSKKFGPFKCSNNDFCVFFYNKMLRRIVMFSATSTQMAE